MRPKRVRPVVGSLLMAMAALAATSCTVAPGPSGPAVGVCFNSLSDPLPGHTDIDLLYTAYNTLNNLSIRDSGDGSCSGAEVGVGTVVIAWDAPSALAVCQSLDPAFDEVGDPPPGVLDPDPGPFFFTCIDTTPPY